MTTKLSPASRRLSAFASTNRRVAFPPTRPELRFPITIPSRVKFALNFASSRETVVESMASLVPLVVSRRSLPLFPGLTISTGTCFGNIRGRKTIAKRTMKTTPERKEYRRSFVAWGGGLRFRLNGASGLEGRAIFMHSLHVNRRPSGDGVVRLLRGVPSSRIVRAEHVDRNAELFRQEVGVLPEHRKLLDGSNSIQFIRFRVLELVTEALCVRGKFLCPFPHAGLRKGSLHEGVHPDGAFLRQRTRNLVDADLPIRRGVQRNALRLDPSDFENLADIRQRRLQEGLGGLRAWVDLIRNRDRVRGVDDEPIAANPMPNLLAGMWRERCQKLRLDLDEPTKDLRSRMALRSPEVPGPSGLDIEVPVAKGGLVVHLLHRRPGRLDRAVQDTQEPGVDAVPLLPAAGFPDREPEPIAEPCGSRGREREVQIRVVEAGPRVRHAHPH